MKKELIEKIRDRFDNEWLLIAVDDIDKTTGVPLSGRLLAHSPRKEDIHKKSIEYVGVAYVVYSEDWPEDLAACFFII